MRSNPHRALVTAVLIGTALVAPVTSAATFDAANVKQLIGAMEQAEARPGPDTIRLAPNQTFKFTTEYRNGLALPPVADELRIQGHKAALKWALERTPDMETGFFRVAKNAALKLRSLTLAGSTASAIITAGSLELENVTLRHNVSYGGNGGALHIMATGQARVRDSFFDENINSTRGFGFRQCDGTPLEVGNGGAIFNQGHLIIARTTFKDNAIDFGVSFHTAVEKAKPGATKFIPTCFGRGGVLYNSGKLSAVNTTLVNDAAGLAGVFNNGRAWFVNVTVAGSQLRNSGDGRFQIGNSTVVGGDCSNLTSLGHNVTAGGCLLNGASDKWIGPITSRLKLGLQEFGGIPVLVPAADSPLVDAADPVRCRKNDTLGRSRPLDGNHDGVARCDVGAVERTPKPYPVDGRVVGLWFEPDRDGHYLLVEQPEPGRLLVFWATYDAAGHPLWLYGVGTVSGNELKVSLVKQQGMRFGSFDRDDMSAIQWGEMTIEFSNCAALDMTWEVAGDPSLNGTATLTRLTEVEGKRCSP